MAYGSVRETTSCMMMEKLKTSPANDPTRTGFLRSSGAVHSRSENDKQNERKTGEQQISEPSVILCQGSNILAGQKTKKLSAWSRPLNTCHWPSRCDVRKWRQRRRTQVQTQSKRQEAKIKKKKHEAQHGLNYI